MKRKRSGVKGNLKGRKMMEKGKAKGRLVNKSGLIKIMENSKIIIIY